MSYYKLKTIIMKTRKHARTITQEIIANIIGWIAGLFSIKIISMFFVVRSWKNAWGLFSRKTTVSSATYEVMEFLVTAIIGFIVLIVVNRLVGKFLLNKNQSELFFKGSTGRNKIYYI